MSLAAPLDEKDRQLINALSKNARATLVELARKIGLSRSATHDRILRLEARGVIRGYTVVLDPAANAADARAFLLVATQNGADNMACADKIDRMAGVALTYCVTGDLDFVVEARCADARQLGDLREAIAKLDGVAHVRTYSVLTARKRADRTAPNS